MRLLLDTHALLWWLVGDERFSKHVREEIARPGTGTLVSAVSAFEITTKYRIGKLPGAGELAQDFVSLVERHGFHLLPIAVDHAVVAGSMAIPHKNPSTVF